VRTRAEHELGDLRGGRPQRVGLSPVRVDGVAGNQQKSIAGPYRATACGG
jgi:hypothetical protein